MSYAEHGPRIFLANRSNAGTPLIYGDYVSPKKRLEGRLKLHDSCSDVRAWSPNFLENSRYFRELTEQSSPIGKIIPYNVVIDNIIQLNSQAQNELQIVKKELQKYRSLKLSPEQEQQLQSLEDKEEMRTQLQSGDCMSLLRDTFVNINESIPEINSKSRLSIHIPFKQHFQNNVQNKSTSKNQSNEACCYSLTAFDPSINNCNLLPLSQTITTHITGDFERPSPWIEYVDVAIQVEIETCKPGKIDGQVDKYFNKTLTTSAMSQTSFTYKYSDEDISLIDLDSSSLHTNNDKEQSFECDTSYSKISQNAETPSESCNEIQAESNSDLHESIIQEESRIIVLRSELCLKDVELKELQDIKNKLEKSVKEKEDYIITQQENFKILQEGLSKLHYQYNYETESLKQQINGYKYFIKQLQQDLNDKSEICHSQSQEIKKLQLCVKDVTALQLENNSISKKLQEMEQSVKHAESCSLALEQIKIVLHEKNELKKQNHAQSCMLADQEEEINQLLVLIKETSTAYEEQKETKNILENLKVDIQNKDIKISQYEKQLFSTKQEISNFFNNLRHILNNLEELNRSSEDFCNYSNYDLDINENANEVLRKINIIMTKFQSYKYENQNLLEQIEDLKQTIENSKQQIHLDYNLKNIICEDFYYESDINLKNTSETENIMLNIRQNTNSKSEIEFEDIYNSMYSESSFQGKNKNLNFYKHKTECHNYIVKLNKEASIHEVDTEIVDYFSYSLIKFHCLTQKLKVYAETERPFIIKVMYNYYEILKNIQSAINISQDITLRKQQISKLHSQYKEEYIKHKSYIEELPTEELSDLFTMYNKINEVIEAILYELLNEILRTEKESLHDKQINHALETCFKSCIAKINNAFQGAGDHHVQVVNKIEKQQRELQEKNTEIDQLKKEITHHLAKKGKELSTKNTLILKLKGQLQMYKNELSTLKDKNKNFNNIKKKLSNECKQNKKRLAIKNKIIKKLKDVNVAMKNNIMDVKRELFDIQLENSKQQNQIIYYTNMMMTEKGETITDLKNSFDKRENILLQKAAEYENLIDEKSHEIIKLKNENKLLCEKLKDIESKLTRMNQTITSLTEQNDKIKIIYMMQEEITKLDKNEKKLKTELNSLKAQLINDQNENKKFNSNLDTLLHENENLQNCVEYWKNENSELSTKLCNVNTEEKLRSKLHMLSNKIQERLSNLKKQLTSEKDLLCHQFNEHLQKKYTVQTMTSPMNQEKEIKENEIEEVVLQNVPNISNIKRSIDAINCATFEQFKSIENDSKKRKYEIKYFENQHKTEELLNEILIRDCKIRNYIEITKRLTQENTDLRALLNSRREEYQNKLTLLKKNYDSSLNAVSERHKETIEILQKQFEDSMKSERMFDSENWLQSLNMMELIELYERICVIINSSSSLMYTKSKSQCFYESDIQKEMYTEVNEVEEKLQIIQKSICEREQPNSRLQKQWPLTIPSNIQRYPTFLQTQQHDKLNVEQNIRYPHSEEKQAESENKYTKDNQTEKDSTFDQQRWNFINQCSAYHKLNNTYEYQRIIHTD